MGKKTKLALTVSAASLAAAWAASKVVAKPIPRENKNALDFRTPIVLAHRGGQTDAPEHTMTAFSKAAAQGVHGFVIDVRLTKDEEIIVFQHESLEITTDFHGNVADYSLHELKKANAAYHYQDDEGFYPYREAPEQIITLKELLELFPQLFIVIRIMDSPNTYEGSLIPSKLWRLLEEMHALDHVAVTSPFDEQTDRFNLYAQHHIAIGAGHAEVRKAYTAYTSQFGHLYNPKADFLIIPEKIGVFSLGTENFLQFLNKLNVKVYFENIYETETFVRLLHAGANGFIVDSPSLALHIIEERSED